MVPQGEDVTTETLAEDEGNVLFFGSSKMRDSIQETHRHLQSSAQEVLDTLFETLAHIDARIFLADQMLFRIQPTATGKLRIRWYRQRGGSIHRTPVFVQLKRKSGKQWTMRLVESPKRSIYRSGDFAECSDEVYALVYHVSELFKRRSKIVQVLTTLIRYYSTDSWRKANEEVIRKFDEAQGNILADLESKGKHFSHKEFNVSNYVQVMKDSIFNKGANL